MLSVLADHLGCLRALNIWLLDLVADQRAFHVLELVLQARQAAVRLAMGSSTLVRSSASQHLRCAGAGCVSALLMPFTFL